MIGDRMRELREDRDMSQRDLGRLLGLDGASAITTISRYERGEKTPSLGRLVEIARALGVEPGDMFPQPA